MPITINFLSIYGIVSLVVHIVGIANAAHAVMNVRSSRGAIAWAISLVTFPWLAIPLYWILGKTRFRGYSKAMRRVYLQHQESMHYAYDEISEFKAELPAQLAAVEKLVTNIDDLAFTNNNAIKLLIDGKQTFSQMLKAIAQAQDYILLQSYIIHDDEIGNKFKDALITKAQAGVRIYLIYDALGSRKLNRTYLNSLRQNGIAVSSFRSSKGKGNRFQLNFRNHRKILVVDGHTGFVGGLNIGDEYLGKDPHFGSWRDTHLKIEGTNVKSLQRTFLRDWYWATKEYLEVSWSVSKNHRDNQTAFVLATGPADPLDVCTLFFLNLINLAQERLWIASPYFVPDDSTLNALKLAALKGVDVRIILPDKPDHLLVYLCSFSYYAELQQVGIKLYRYRSGFMHQKIILCDRQLAGVGTTNLDNRSFFLNFEVMIFAVKCDRQRSTTSPDLVESVEKMLIDDLNASRLVNLEKYQHKPFWFRLSAEVSRLSAPIL
ncbi:cardiolipin synthase [Pleurocapsa sp. CCALA 161]|uniref:cardiolipin synthase n=1 Tax=Pleurocapsa sp. CCALA 161 TaxID=2107688 RepID=UPI000D07AAC8|nr:cardiolipin synthase [Pleurocapsa sp. CCALA 161]PSB09385.1 cardiolipin synthase [Pleurocapsa sp. CCALA 161]